MDRIQVGVGGIMKWLVGLGLAICVEVTMAGQEARNVGVAIGTDSKVRAVVFLSDAWGINAGYYHYLYDRPKGSVAGYQHTINFVYMGLRRNWNVMANTDFFLEGDLFARISNYSGNIGNESNRQTIYGIYPGFELRLNEKVSVAGKAGLEYLRTTYKTYKDTAFYGPIGSVELIYYF